MSIPSQIQIPNLYVENPWESALKQGLSGFQRSQGLKQRQQQLDLQKQLAEMQMKKQQQQQEQQQQMQPLQQQLLQAQVQKTQAEAGGIPGKQQFDMMMKQRAQDNKIVELGTNNPDLLNDPQFLGQFNHARSRVSQDITMGGAQQQPGMQQAPQQMPQPGKIQQQPTQFGLQGAVQQISQPQQQNSQQPDIAEQMQFRQEQKMMPADLKNQMVRSSSASSMIEDLKGTLSQLQPFFGVSGGMKGAVRAYAASKGLTDDQAGRMFNTLSKKINATAGEVAAGMTKSRSEATMKEWQDIVNPVTSKGISYEQVMDNLGALEDIHNMNSKALFSDYPVSSKHHDNFVNSQKQSIQKKYAQNVPRGTQSGQQQFAHEDLMAEAKRRGLIK